MLYDAISEVGYDVVVCENAREALDIAYEKSFDLWILDVKVPLGNGFEVLKELREAGKNTPAVFLTSLSTLEDLKVGIIAYFLVKLSFKPIIEKFDTLNNFI